jgi:hypothetical protein
VQAISRREVSRRHTRSSHRLVVLADRLNPALQDRYAKRGQSLVQRLLQNGPSYAESGPLPEASLDLTTSVEVTDPVERPTGCFDPEPAQILHRGVRDAFAAGLVDWRLPRLDHDNLKAG